MSNYTSKKGPEPSGAGNSIPSADAVEQTLETMGVPTAQIEEILWLVDFARAQRINSFSALAKEVGVSEATISTILRGKYGATKAEPEKRASLAGFCNTIENFRRLWIERQAIGQEPWVPELSIVKRIYPFCDLVRAANQIGIIWGPNQSGKSKTLEHYANDRDGNGRSIHPLTAYASLPPGGACVPSMHEIAAARGGISTRKRHAEMRNMILRRFHSGWLLIVDEFHQTLKGRTFKNETIDRIREIHDRCKCPVILCGTDVVPEMMEDPRFKDFLGQIGNRGVLKLRIPPAPEPKDIELLARAYGIDHAPDEKAAKIAKQIGDENGISKLTDYFKVARQLAGKAHERLAWKHFVITHSTLDSWSKGQFSDGKKVD
jgi:DNA transposition AAA+ family ATPase